MPAIPTPRNSSEMSSSPNQDEAEKRAGRQHPAASVATALTPHADPNPEQPKPGVWRLFRAILARIQPATKNDPNEDHATKNGHTPEHAEYTTQANTGDYLSPRCPSLCGCHRCVKVSNALFPHPQPRLPRSTPMRTSQPENIKQESSCDNYNGRNDRETLQLTDHQPDGAYLVVLDVATELRHLDDLSDNAGSAGNVNESDQLCVCNCCPHNGRSLPNDSDWITTKSDQTITIDKIVQTEPSHEHPHDQPPSPADQPQTRGPERAPLVHFAHHARLAVLNTANAVQFANRGLQLLMKEQKDRLAPARVGPGESIWIALLDAFLAWLLQPAWRILMAETRQKARAGFGVHHGVRFIFLRAGIHQTLVMVGALMFLLWVIGTWMYFAGVEFVVVMSDGSEYASSMEYFKE